MDPFVKRTWAEIDLDAVAHNYRVIRAAVSPESKIMCVIKADAYGHGATYLAQEYERLGADWFAVSNIEEAVQLRRLGLATPILILGYTPPDLARYLAENKITQAILSLGYARQLSQQAQQAGVSVKVHIKLDTGMSRIGLQCQDIARDAGTALREAAEICTMKGLQAEGVFTHFAVSDEGEAGAAFTNHQYQCFMHVVNGLRQQGFAVPLCHCGNSGAILDYPSFHLDMVRAGIILYGLQPSGQVSSPLPLRPAMQLRSVVSLIKTVPAGTPVSYGCTYTTQDETRVATVPIGYADGYPRALSGKAEMLVHGQRAPVIGRVCMDQLMLDVTGIDGVKEGDLVTVFGRDGDAFLPVEELAQLCGTIPYEIICMEGKRVPRIYMRQGEIVGEMNLICP